jgi:hypothetical protein
MRFYRIILLFFIVMALGGSLARAQGDELTRLFRRGCVNAETRSVVLICDRSGRIEVWAVVNGQGELAIRVTERQIQRIGIPEENTLIADGRRLGFPDIRLYRLDTGEFQVNAPAHGNFNGYVFIWTSLYHQPPEPEEEQSPEQTPTPEPNN